MRMETMGHHSNDFVLRGNGGQQNGSNTKIMLQRQQQQHQGGSKLEI